MFFTNWKTRAESRIRIRNDREVLEFNSGLIDTKPGCSRMGSLSSISQSKRSTLSGFCAKKRQLFSSTTHSFVYVVIPSPQRVLGLKSLLLFNTISLRLRLAQCFCVIVYTFLGEQFSKICNHSSISITKSKDFILELQLVLKKLLNYLKSTVCPKS